jgi:hypothetical protein
MLRTEKTSIGSRTMMLTYGHYVQVNARSGINL